MRAAISITALLLTACWARAEVIDRIAATVANRVITRSALDREMRVAAFLNGSAPVASAAARRAALERMIEQSLIRRELETARYPAPSAAEVAPLVDALKRARSAAPGGFERALAAASITEQDLRDEVLWQRTFLMFLEVRFRPGVQVTSADVESYFQSTVRPAALAANPGAAPNLEDYRARIEEKLTGDRVDREVDAWLKEIRGRTEIAIHEEALR